MRIALVEHYYGTTSRPKNPFRNCKSPSEVFNLSRRISLEMSTKLKRIGVLCSESGEVLLKGEKHKILNVEKFKYGSQEQTPKQAPVEKFYKRDLFLPVMDMLTEISSQFMQHEGIKVEALNGKKIYCRDGVWPPTQERLYNLFNSYLQERVHMIRELEGVLDIGAGSGILSILLQKFIGKHKKVFAVDANEEAIKTIDMNKNIIGIESVIEARKLDLVEFSKLAEAQGNKMLKAKGMPQKYELIVANPPWIWAKPIKNDQIDDGNFDQDGEFLNSLFRFCEQRLQIQGATTKDGTLLLIFSDLSANLGLTPKSIVETLCTKHNLTIRGTALILHSRQAINSFEIKLISTLNSIIRRLTTEEEERIIRCTTDLQKHEQHNLI